MAENSETKINAMLDKYTSMIEQPGGPKMSEMITALEADYRDPSKQMTLKDTLHLAIKAGFFMKISAIENPKL